MENESLGQIPPPFSLALGICDLIHRDQGSGKRYILGCFSVLHATSFPCAHPLICVYADLTNGRGKVPVRVQIVDSDEERPPICVLEQEMDFPDPRMIAELDFGMAGLVFPEPGEYRVQLFASGHHVIERRLLVNKLEQPQ